MAQTDYAQVVACYADIFLTSRHSLTRTVAQKMNYPPDQGLKEKGKLSVKFQDFSIEVLSTILSYLDADFFTSLYKVGTLFYARKLDKSLRPGDDDDE